MRRLFTMTIVLAVACAGLIAPSGAAALSADASAKPQPTGFALLAVGFGSRVEGGQLPAGSDATAYEVIGCTQMSGKMRKNYEAEVEVPGLGLLEGVTTKLWTEKKGGTVSSYSSHSIARVTIGESSFGQIVIKGVESLARAFHDAKGYHTEHTYNIASIVLQQAGGPSQQIDIPAPGQPITIPGLARISIGRDKVKELADGIKISADVLDIKVIPLNTRARVAHTTAKIEAGIKSGIFRGFSASTKARGVADNVRSGRTPLSLVPCQGTRSGVKSRAVAHVNLGDNLIVRGLDSQVFGKQTQKAAQGFTRGQVAQLELGDGDLVINGVVAQANVKRIGNQLVRNAKGTTVAEIIANGETYSFPSTGVIEIPGIARIEDAIVKKIPNGLSVVALRVTLLDGSGAVVDLGLAELQIRGARGTARPSA